MNDMIVAFLDNNMTFAFAITYLLFTSRSSTARSDSAAQPWHRHHPRPTGACESRLLMWWTAWRNRRCPHSLASGGAFWFQSNMTGWFTFFILIFYCIWYLFKNRSLRFFSTIASFVLSSRFTRCKFLKRWWPLQRSVVACLEVLLRDWLVF